MDLPVVGDALGDFLAAGVERLADDVEHVAEHAVPTGTCDAARPCSSPRAPRLRPSVGFMAMARTRLSPMCCATSAVISMVSPSTSTVNVRAKLISGSASGGNSTSTTGPAMATMRPSLSRGWLRCMLNVSPVQSSGLSMPQCRRVAKASCR